MDRPQSVSAARCPGVCANMDPMKARTELPSKDTLEIEGRRIGIIHPSKGGTTKGLGGWVMAEFEHDDVDTLVFGHIHEPKDEMVGKVLFNPGKGYKEKSYFEPPASIGILTIGEEIRGKILEIG